MGVFVLPSVVCLAGVLERLRYIVNLKRGGL
jgi:hypothetical protein